jgi:2-C-methyl-D-erythritol 4-phosphate cytidylyltransferase
MQEQASAVIVAAGASRRMQGRDKIWMPLAGRIALARTLDVFQNSALIDHIVLVTSSERLEDASALWQQDAWSKVSAVVVGGTRRQDSVRVGLDALADAVPQCRWVMIHDAARPFVTEAILEAGLQAVQEHQAVVAAIPVSDTIKQVKQGIITATLDRTQLWSIQTPQVFSFPLIHQAHHTPQAQGDVTDDATLLELLGHRVAIFAGSPANFKITTQEDILLAEALLQR